jgi:Uncharacterized conserved protein
VHRLTHILDYLNKDPQIKNLLALKGGTAINLTQHDIPRLSFDIDLDYTIGNDRDSMFKDRELIKSSIFEYLKDEGYELQAKFHHALDSLKAFYVNSAGNRDGIKIEINYMLRQHLLPLENRTIKNDLFTLESPVLCVNMDEIFGSKITALMDRTLPRDLFDVSGYLKSGVIRKSEILKKSVIFYSCLSYGSFDTGKIQKIDSLAEQDIKEGIVSVIRKKESFDLEREKANIKEFLNELLVLDRNEIEYVRKFEKGKYSPEFLFEGMSDILKRIEKHPMVIWKMSNITKERQMEI